MEQYFGLGSHRHPCHRCRGLLPAGVLGGLPELGAEESLRGPACWNGASGTTAREEAGNKLGQFSAIL